jgi:hypothetical protein
MNISMPRVFRHPTSFNSSLSKGLPGLLLFIGISTAPALASAAFTLPSTDGTTSVNFDPFDPSVSPNDTYGDIAAARAGVLTHIPTGYAASAATAKYDVVILLPGTNMDPGDMSQMLRTPAENGWVNDTGSFTQELNNQIIYLIPQEGTNMTNTSEPKQWTGFARDPVTGAVDPNSFWDFRRLTRLADDLRNSNAKVRKVFVAGFSAGGSMTRMLMCFAGNKFDGYGVLDGIKSSPALYEDCGQHWNDPGSDVNTVMLQKVGFSPVGFGVSSPAPAGQKFVRPVFVVANTHSTNSGAFDLGDLYDNPSQGIVGSVYTMTGPGTLVQTAPGAAGDVELDGQEDNQDFVDQTQQAHFNSAGNYPVLAGMGAMPFWQFGFEHFADLMGADPARYRTSVQGNSAGLSFTGDVGIAYLASGAFPVLQSYIGPNTPFQLAGAYDNCAGDFCFRFPNWANYCNKGKSFFRDPGQILPPGTTSVYSYFAGQNTGAVPASGTTGLAYIEVRGGKHAIPGRAASCIQSLNMEYGRTRDFDTAEMMIKFFQARAGLSRQH